MMEPDHFNTDTLARDSLDVPNDTIERPGAVTTWR